MDTIITTRGLTKTFPLSGGNCVPVLKGIDVEVKRQSLTILKGRSGSGKTTLLNILSALDLPSEGTVLFEDRDLTRMTEEDRERLRRTEMGYVFQSVALVPVMNVYENVEFSLRLSGYRGDRKARVEECLHRVGMYKRRDHFPSELSGGEQQRAAIARAIAHGPKVIFADEPTGALDADNGLMVVGLFRELVEKEGLTIVMTTHDPGLMGLGDTVYEMEDGEIHG